MRFRSQYDIPTAVTFLMVGLGIGSILAILFSSSPNSARPIPIPLRTKQQPRQFQAGD